MGPFLRLFETGNLSGEEHSLIIIVCNNSTSGSHGWGDMEEEPAPDPVSNAVYELCYDPALEKVINPFAQSVDYGIHERGSYHERWFDAGARVNLVVPFEVWDDDFFSTLERFERRTRAYDEIFKPSRNLRRAKYWRGPWQGFEAAKDELSSVAEDYNTKSRKFQNSADFWRTKVDDIIAQHSLKRPLDGD